MSIQDIIKSGANVSITVNAFDLREFFLSLVSEQIDKVDSKPSEIYITAEEVSKKLSVDKSTLWRWDKSGYLPKIKMGGKIRYRLSDIEKLMKEG